MAGALTLWLARHARPLCEDGLCYGATDLAADAQATTAAAAGLAAALPAGLRVTSSPLRRCVQLAEALQSLRPDLAWTTDARLAEMHFGDWEGRRWNAIAQEEVDRWVADFAHHRRPGGESVREVVGRVGLALADASARGGAEAWITHAGVVSAVRWLSGPAGCGTPAAGSWPRPGLAFGAFARVRIAAECRGGVRENVERRHGP